MDDASPELGNPTSLWLVDSRALTKVAEEFLKFHNLSWPQPHPLENGNDHCTDLTGLLFRRRRSCINSRQMSSSVPSHTSIFSTSLASWGLAPFIHLPCPLPSLPYPSLIPSRPFPNFQRGIQEKETQARSTQGHGQGKMEVGNATL